MFGRNKGVTLERVEMVDAAEGLDLRNVWPSLGLGHNNVEEIEEQIVEEQIEVEVPSSVAVMERAKEAITPFDNDSDLEWLDSELARLRREKQHLLGIEAHAEQALNQKIMELSVERTVAAAFTRFGGEKLRLDPEVLNWRKRELGPGGIPFPEVALFSLDQNVMSISGRFAGHVTMNPPLPYGLQKRYLDVSNALAELSQQDRGFYEYSINAAFSGLIPLETKEKIMEASRSGVFSEIRVLAEAEWTVQSAPTPRYADPIVIGLVNDEMWVIDVFDPTPLEDYIAKEFTT